MHKVRCCERVLTQRVSFSILVRDSEDTHHFVTLLPQVGVHLLAKEALANDGEFELILVIMLEHEGRRKTLVVL